jgi:hypothetical protein
MPKLTHQVEELKNAVSQLINVERTKAKLDVFTIIKDGHEQKRQAVDILQQILNWVALDDK